MELNREGLSYQSEKITQTLFSISNAVNTTDNLDDLYKSIYKALNKLINLPNFFIAIVDKEKKLLSFPFFIDENDTKETITMGLEKYEESTSNTSQVIITKKLLLLKKDILQEKLAQKKIIGTVSAIWLGIPLIVRDEVIGVMVVQHYSDPEYFTQKDLDLLTSVSDQVALAIDRQTYKEDLKKAKRKTEQANIELKNEINERKRSEDINKTLFAISNAMSVTLDLNDLYKKIHQLLGKIIDVKNFYIAIIDHKEDTLHFPYFVDIKDDPLPPIENFSQYNSLSGLVISQQKPILLNQKEIVKRHAKNRAVGTLSMIWMGVPLMIKNQVIGLIAVQSYTDPDLYNKQDLNVLASVSDQVAIAIDRKRTEDGMRESEKRYRYLFDNAPVAMYEIDFIKGKFLNVNKVLCSNSGYTKDEFLALDPLRFLTKESKKRFLETYGNLLKGKKVSDNIEYSIYKKNGEKVRVMFNYDFIYKDKKVIGAQVAIHNITERKKIEKAIIQSEKMMSVGGLAAGMAHEINNPLAGIMQNVQLVINRLSKSLPANDKAALESGTTMAAINDYMAKRKIFQLLDNIHRAGGNAAKIVNNMLSFAQKGTSAKSGHNISELINKTIELARNDYDLKKKYNFRNIEIVNNCDPSIPPIACEENKILQVFFNIIKNAVESMQGDNQKKDCSRLTFRAFKIDNTAQIEIEDNGPGMDEAVRKRIFEPFFTTKDVNKGTGLGLSLSYFLIVDDHDGKMEVESILGRGTKFIIKLPLI